MAEELHPKILLDAIYYSFPISTMPVQQGSNICHLRIHRRILEGKRHLQMNITQRPINCDELNDT